MTDYIAIEKAVRYLYPSAGDRDFAVMPVPSGESPLVEWNIAKLGPKPSQARIEAAIPLALAQEAANAYKIQRAAEYPPMTDYLDAQMKKASADAAVRLAGIAQEQAYVSACAAVKAKWPKS